MVSDDCLKVGIFLTSRVVVLKHFGFRAPLFPTELLRAPKNFCLCKLYLSIFTVLETKAEKLLKYLFNNSF